MKINVECATLKDYPKFKELHKRYLNANANHHENEKQEEAEFINYVERESLLIAYVNDIAIGYAMLNGYDDGSCEIYQIFIAPEEQNNGYGKQLVDYIMEMAKQEGFKKLNVFCLDIDADRFWMLKCGFEADELGYLVREIK